MLLYFVRFFFVKKEKNGRKILSLEWGGATPTTLDGQKSWILNKIFLGGEICMIISQRRDSVPC